jgi:hypothetical protein
MAKLHWRLLTESDNEDPEDSASLAGGDTEDESGLE